MLTETMSVSDERRRATRRGGFIGFDAQSHSPQKIEEGTALTLSGPEEHQITRVEPLVAINLRTAAAMSGTS